MNKRIPILLGFFLTFIAIWVVIFPNRHSFHLIERLDNLGYDIQLRTRVLTETKHLDTPVVIVDVDDKSLKAEGRWPWSRNKIAALVTEIQKQGAVVIAFDMFFPEPEINIASQMITELSKLNRLTPSLETALKENVPFFTQDETLAKVLKTGNSVLALGFLPRKQFHNNLPKPLLKLSKEQDEDLDLYYAQGFISNVPILQNVSAGSGFLNIYPDSDGIIRRAPLLMVYGNDVYPSLSLQAVMSFLGESIELVTPAYHEGIQLEGVKLGEAIIPTDAKSQVLIPFVGRSYTFPFYSATDILHGKMPKDTLLGKIVFIGTSATGGGDLKPTAIENPFPGVEIQATLAHGLLLNNFSYKPAWVFGAQVMITALFGLIAALLFPYLGPRTLSIIIVLFPPGLLLLNNWLWLETGLILSLLIPMILVLMIAVFNIIYGYLFETRRREHLKEMFGQYVPEKHIDEMLKTSTSYALRGEDRQMSVLFADIRNFTSISEGLSATELVDMLNTFFTPMTEIIFKHQGTIDKYVGDLIMAFWGAPLKDKFHARHAIQSALEMQNKIRVMQKEFSARGWPEFKMGIGINSGIMSVGDMGSRFRRNYTVLGDAVNLASRIEGLTKFYGVDILVTEETAKDQTRYIFRKLDLVRVKGKQKGLAIFEVVCKQADATPELIADLALYHQALDYYLAQDWEKALDLFKKLHEKNSEVKIYTIYIERIKEFEVNPLPPNWDGVYTHITK